MPMFLWVVRFTLQALFFLMLTTEYQVCVLVIRIGAFTRLAIG